MTDTTDDSRFAVPEPPVGISDGFLSEYWQQSTPLPRIRGIKVLWYFLQRGVQTVTSLPLSSFVTVMTIALSLFLLSAFLLVVQNVGRVLADSGGSLSVTAYVKEGIDEKLLGDFIRELEANSRIRSLEFIAKDEALVRFRKDLGVHSSLLEGLDGSNPLPASLELVVQPDELGIDSTGRLVEDLRQRADVVDEVVYGNEFVDRLKGLLNVFRLFGSIGLLIVLSVVVFLVANTIKLAFFARRDEISIMQLVGASEWFVKMPFIIGGVIQGAVGSALGMTLLWLTFSLLRMQLSGVAASSLALPTVFFLSPVSICGIIVLGVMLGALGSLFSLGRFMNV